MGGKKKDLNLEGMRWKEANGMEKRKKEERTNKKEEEKEEKGVESSECRNVR